MVMKSDKLSLRNTELTAEIHIVFDKNHHRYGVYRVYQELLNRGYEVNHKGIQRYASRRSHRKTP